MPDARDRYRDVDMCGWPTFLTEAGKEFLLKEVKEILEQGPQPLWIIENRISYIDGNPLKGVALWDARFCAIQRACDAVGEQVYRLKS